MTAQDLPAEILTHIFSYVYPHSQIATCRLVCKNWNKPAETALLGTYFYLDLDAPTAEKYFAFLSKDPARGQLVRGVTYSAIEGDKKKRELVKKVVRLIFTPHLEALGGFSLNAADDFVFEYMNQISDTHRARYTKLRSIPLRSPINDLYIQTLLNFKHTLASLSIKEEPGSGYLINRLDQFTNLTDFTYAGNLIDLSHLESILRKCPKLESLTLRIHQYSTGEMRYVLFEDEILQWAKANDNVVINNQLKTLELAGDGGCSPELWDYVAYKYPKLEKVTVVPTDIFDEDGYMFQYQDETWLDYERMKEAFKNIPTYMIEFEVESEFEEEDLYMALKRPNNKVFFDLDEEEDVNRVIVTLQ